MPINIKTTQDWQNLKGNNLTQDPMVLRCGELFLEGVDNVEDKVEVWNLLSEKIMP